jgi:hypothetical protein
MNGDDEDEGFATANGEGEPLYPDDMPLKDVLRDMEGD